MFSAILEAQTGIKSSGETGQIIHSQSIDNPLQKADQEVRNEIRKGEDSGRYLRENSMGFVQSAERRSSDEDNCPVSIIGVCRLET